MDDDSVYYYHVQCRETLTEILGNTISFSAKFMVFLSVAENRQKWDFASVEKTNVENL